MEELKECPFCGEKAQLVRFEDKEKGQTWFGVRCKNYDCIANDISPEYGYEHRAVACWNRRSLPLRSYWKKSAEGYKICNNCKADVAVFSGHRSFCPNCGAMMDGDTNE